MEQISVYVVDDEKEAVSGLLNLLGHQPDARLLGSAHNGIDAIKGISALRPDLLFLDVQMPGINGFEVLSSLNPDHLPLVIFTTAYDKWAIEAFEQRAVDFLLKPFTNDRFKEAFSRALEVFQYQRKGHMSEALTGLLSQMISSGLKEDKIIPHLGEPDSRLLVYKCEGKIRFTHQSEILFFESLDNYVKIHTQDNISIIRKPLKALLDSVNADDFIRIHRSYVVNINNISFLEPLGGGDYQVKLNGGVTIKCSRSYKQQLFDKVGYSVN